MTGLQALHPVINIVATALELAGVLVIVGGVILASLTFVREGRGGMAWRDAYERYRSNLGRGILLGLEFLVGADIITTITAPLTVQSIALLGAVVFIRTFLSFSLEIEIEGCWPWERARRAGPEPDRER
jgi:uncharacterized membrane protein